MSVKVNINADELAAGEEIILTLEDQYLLKGNEVNEDNDILENLHIKENDKLEFRKQQQERIKQQHYFDKYEDENGQKHMLSKYDEQKMEKKGFFIDENGETVQTREKVMESIANKLKKQNNEINLFFDDKIASDYNQAEPAAPVGFKKRKLNPQKVDISRHLELETAVPQAKPESMEMDEEQQLQQALEAKMQLKLLSLKQKKSVNQEERLQDLMAQNKKLEEQTQKKREDEFVKPSSKPAVTSDIEEINLISQQTDFLKGISTDLELKERDNRGRESLSIRDSRAGITSIVNVALPSERFFSQVKKVEKQEETHLDEEDQVEIEKAEEEIGFLEDEKHSVGLAATLRNVLSRGLLNDNVHEFVGRSKDARKADAGFENNYKDIVLEYRNDKGKIMTPNEAFRYQCHIFHGKQPSKNKIEKMLKKQMIQEKVKSLKETPLQKALAQEQQKTNLPYMMITAKKQI